MTRVPANTLLLVPACAQMEGQRRAPSLQCHCRPALGMRFLLPISPRRRWAVAAGIGIQGQAEAASPCSDGSCAVQAMHRKGEFPKAGDSGDSEPCSPSLPAHMEGETAGMQEVSEFFTQEELQQDPLFQLCIPDPMPKFSSGSVIHLSEQASCWFEFMQLKSSWMLLNIALVLDFFLCPPTPSTPRNLAPSHSFYD